jgi:peptidoglycan hydrolase FlgJ
MLNVDSPVYTDFQSLSKLKLDAQEQTPEAIQQVAKQFESVFLGMMLKSMRQAGLSEGLLESQQSEFYRDMYDQQIALNMAGKQGFGLADFIVKQLSPKKASGEKKELDDYLQDADIDSLKAMPAAQNPVVNAGVSSNPLDASGLRSLERNLARLEMRRQAMSPQWQTQDDEWQTQKLAVDPVLTSKQDFMQQLRPHALQAAQALGVDANLLLAQAALETGWGQAVIKNNQGESSFNLFNIKADKSWQGKQAKTLTLEFAGGIAKKEMAGFRSYSSFKASFDDYVDFIKSNPRYSEALKKAGNPAQYVQELQQAGYATDPKYAEKILNIYNSQMSGQARALNGAG